MTDAKRTEAQGERSRRIGKTNQTKILLIIKESPLTFNELCEKVGFSKPVLSKHLQVLREKGLVEKAIQGDNVVYQVVSKEKVKKEIKAELFDLISYIFPPAAPAINRFVAGLATAIMESGFKTEEIKEQLGKELMQRIHITDERDEPLIAFKQSTFERFKKKYPEIAKELLEAD